MEYTLTSLSFLCVCSTSSPVPPLPLCLPLPQLYVSWSGTDSDGIFLSSSGKRLSQFRRWSLSSVYNQATNFNTADLAVVQPAENQ